MNSGSVESMWGELKRRVNEVDTLGSVIGLLGWDQQTHMPAGGARNRGEQMAAMTAIVHAKSTDAALRDLLDQLEGAPAIQQDRVRQRAIADLKRRTDRASKVPEALVRATAKAKSEGFAAWNQARADHDFSVFSGPLKTLINLSREQAACYGPAAHPYDNLLENYDPGTTTAQLQPMFESLSKALVPFVESIADKAGPAPLVANLHTEGQKKISQHILDALGFRSDCGRLDESVHPFTCGISPSDVRLTTHYEPNDLLGVLGATIHECGHGLYEQGLPQQLAGTGLDHAAGMGLHESQSRFWENVIGRSQAFCDWLHPTLTTIWPDFPLDAAGFYGACNRITPSLIRVKADEVTYNLHIIVRFKLELAILSGDLQADDLPGAWNDLYAKIVTVRPTDPVDGILQDVHWSHGLFGYFPSYTLGNLYAASFAHKMEEDLPDMWDQVRNGQFAEILNWLRLQVHQRGRCADAPDIVREVVGERDAVADLMNRFVGRQGVIYGVR